MPEEKIAGETFNAGYQNQTVNELAEIAKEIVEEEFPEKKPIRSSGRLPTTSAPTGSLRVKSPRSSAGGRSEHRGRRARPLPGVQGGQFPGDTLKDERSST